MKFQSTYFRQFFSFGFAAIAFIGLAWLGKGWGPASVSSAHPLAATAAPQRPPQAIESLPELQTQEKFPAEAEFKPDCTYAKLYEQIGGKIDNFGGGPDPVQLSPELATFLAGKPSVRQFDNGNGDAIFGHSFQFETCFKDCRLCGAQLEIELKADGGPANNDVVYLYGKNIQSSDLLWSGKAVAGKTTVTLPPKSLAKLNDYLCRNQSAKPWVNLLTQDDHKVNYAKLRVWYY